MSKIKLTGESSGYVEISAGDSAGNNTLEVPTSGTRLVAHEGTQNVSLGGRLNVSGISTFSSGLNVTGGSIGIGTDNPGKLLHISSNSAPTIRIENTDTTAVVDQIVGSLEFEGNDSSSNANGVRAKIDAEYRGVGAATALKLYTAWENETTLYESAYFSKPTVKFTTNDVERLRITSTGNIGIGTDDPQTGLHIDSTTNAQSRITISKSGFLRNNFIGIDGDADELVIAADESNEGPGSHIRFKVDGTEELRIDSNGLKFNGDTAAANALDDYEEGNITTWRLKKDGANTDGSNNVETHVRYTKIGRCVYISGYIRTDSTQGSQSGNVLLVTVADATVAATLPFTPNHSGGIPIIHTRTINELDHPISLAFVKDSATIYIYANESTGDYIADSNTLSTNTQTNIVITFSGHFFTDS